MPADNPPSFANLFGWSLPFASAGNFAPNPGWTFGNLVINGSNSRAPQVEQAIVSRLSYGRQLGKVIEALEALCDASASTRDDPRVVALKALADEVRAIKRSAASDRLARLKGELEALRAEDPAAWRRLIGPTR